MQFGDIVLLPLRLLWLHLCRSQHCWEKTWAADPRTRKKRAGARGRRGIGAAPPPAAQPTAGPTVARRVAGSPGPTLGLGPETCGPAHALMRDDADIDPVAALLMALEENEAEVVPGVEGNLIEVRGQGQKAEQEGLGQDIVAPIAEAVKGPVTEGPAVALEIGNVAEAERRRKGRRRRLKTKSRRASSVGNLQTSKLD